jgi:RNA polymerase sigma-70 factor (ECF subfamily)
VRERIRRRLSPAVRRRVADSDVLQETLLVAARRIEDFEYRGVGSFQAWLAAIGDNAARKVIEQHAGTRKRDVRTEVSRDARAATAQYRGGTPSPSHAAMADETRRRVAEALREMPEAYQAVIQLLQHRRVTLAEAAELMGRSVNAVKKLHARALSELADRLGIEGRRSL